ncbi:MAG: type I-C CRISPR-associated endonuclease Cas1 [Clostridiaceae bacterium]|nr:type I-C CRISPR-associated endonuclease Cas1 [Clostridiaceae bacterium]
MRKLLNSLYILDETAYLSLDGENIVCKSDQKEKFRLPLSTIEEIFCFSYLGCSPALMGKCLENAISISFISPQGKFLSRLQGATKGNIYLRKVQFEKFGTQQTLLIQNTVAAKLSNTRQLIRRSMRDNPQLDDEGRLSNCIGIIENGIENVYTQTDLEIIMGIEGNCAKAYFYILSDLILQQKDDFTVVARTKRPPMDRVNALLSFLYTIATSSCASALESVGLDSYLGYYHAMRSGRCSLACDLVEEMRAVIDRLVLTMINLKQVNANDFEKQVSGAIYLNKDGKRKVLTLWQERKRSIVEHAYLGQKIPFGLLPFVQSSLLAKHIRGEIEEYPSFLMK